ncbi:MAG TPA: hypothetical protein VGC95_01345 [Chitinophagaceae bacterium]
MQSFEPYFSLAVANRERLQRTFFCLVTVLLIYRFVDGLMLHSIGRSPVLDQEPDPAYWVVMMLRLPDLFSGAAAMCFDGLLVAFAAACALFIGVRLLPIIFFAGYFLYFMLFNLSAGHHYINFAIIWLSAAFIFQKESFGYWWAFARFVFMLMMFASGCWKVIRGNFWENGHLQMIMQTRPGFFRMVEAGSGPRYHLAKWLFQHPAIGVVAWDFLIVFELVFVIGFFSFRRDLMLLAAYLGFFFGSLLLTSMYNLENLLFLFTLYPVLRLLSKRRNVRARQGPLPVVN